MKKKGLFILVLFVIIILPLIIFLKDNSYSIVFIHIGKSIPAHVPEALNQARIFNPDCQIILVANEEALEKYAKQFQNANVKIITCESLKKSNEHVDFQKRSGLDNKWHNGFCLYTSERFLYLQDLMEQHNLKNVFHLENDNMLYTNLADLLPIFKENYKGFAITMDNDERCIPGFVYISGSQVMTKLAKYFADKASNNYFDMQVLAKFRNEFGNESANNLPIISETYVRDQAMVSPENHRAGQPFNYCLNFDLFHSIFDAAAIGQYLGGIDPIIGNSVPGFINESCVFNPSLLSYEWIEDNKGRKVPYGIYANEKFRINNLHIHSKDLVKFSSITIQ